MLALLRGLTRRTACTDRTCHNVASGRVQRATRECFSWPDVSDRNWSDAPPCPINPSCFAVPLGTWPDVPVPRVTRHAGANPSPHASAAALNWPDASPTSGHCQWPPFTSVSIHDDLENFSASGVVENMHFTSMKAPNPASQAWRRERGPQTHLYCWNSTSFANVLTPPSVYHYVHVC
jgi:hypothetical protein